MPRNARSHAVKNPYNWTMRSIVAATITLVACDQASTGPGDLGPALASAPSAPGIPANDLGTLGGASAVARAASSDGIIVGRSAIATGQFLAFVWTQVAGMRELPSLAGPREGNAVAIANGVVVGMSANKAASWQRDGSGAWVVTNLGSLGGMVSDVAWDINASGVIVGSAYRATWELRGFRWTSGTGLVELPILAGATGIQALSINGSGTIVGVHNEGNRQLPIAWTPSGIKRLPVCSGAIHAWAEAINDAGVAVGSCNFGTSSWAVRWQPSPDPLTPDTWLAPQALASGTGTNRAWNINNSGQIVGESGGKGFLWEEGRGLRVLGSRGQGWWRGPWYLRGRVKSPHRGVFEWDRIRRWKPRRVVGHSAMRDG
jgi:hypothetical protein